MYVTRSTDNKTSRALILQEWIMIIFAAFGFLLNFVFQPQRNNVAFLLSFVHYHQAFLRLVSAIRRRRVRLNRRRLRNLPCPGLYRVR